MSTFFLTLFSFFGGVAGLIGAYHRNLLLLKIGTVVACLFCMRHVDFVGTITDRISRKFFMIIFGNIVAKAINIFCAPPVAALNWMIIDGLFTLLAAATVLDIIRNQRDGY